MAANKNTAAVFETLHFEFVAVGATEADALATLRRAWAVHAEQTGADPEYLAEYECDVNYRTTRDRRGTCTRDGNRIELD
jgi:hypothetical protein